MTEVFTRQDGDEVTVLAHLNHPPRKLKAVWSLEAEQDLQAWINTPATQRLAEEITRNVLRDLGIEEITPQEVNWKEEGF